MARSPKLSLDPDDRSYRYYRNAVERHWDPGEIDLSTDRERVTELSESGLTDLRRTLALFGAGEQSVTEDLAPLAAALDDPNDQAFVASQIYEEAKHADFFDRNWRRVIRRAEDELGVKRSDPSDPRWFSDAYVELFDRNERAMARLLTDDSPEARADAYCHYHLTIEGILAQTGYYGVQTNFGGDVAELPTLPGLVEGFSNIRSDEGRHVGFGMAKLKGLVGDGSVSVERLWETVGELVPLTQSIVSASADDDSAGLGEDELVTYAAERHTDRMAQIADSDAELPSVGELTRIE
ncbi:ribonucleoside-diphosphate reductase [Halostella sp. JP-L12]|uniref:ribonucleotide-diphosphate reductase subunit beta n=1 Tax=Halostella TaxID=1843185 RepID=UPI000EF8104F|nr:MULTISPECIES: ribonucleotide-diphosphate reductase subunit beta [Halostella]NHN48313.1 ribonucleoside-diphosphate reductase [Halostella sp. JP-L12]